MASLAPQPSSTVGSAAPSGSVSGNSGASSSNLGQSTKAAFNDALRARNEHNNYIAHLKIWEQVEGNEANGPVSQAGVTVPSTSRKARYLILAVQRDSGKVTINKAKRNANGSFSIGKDWDLNTLRAVEVSQPTQFTVTLTRSYSWSTDRAREQFLFLSSVVNVYRKYTRDTEGPQLIGLDMSQGSSNSEQRPVVSSQPEANVAVQPLQTTRPSDGQLPSSPPKNERTQTYLRPLEITRPSAPYRSFSASGVDGDSGRHNVPSQSRSPPTAERSIDSIDGAGELSPPPGSSPQTSKLLSPLTRRPTLMRNDSAVPRLEGNESHRSETTLVPSPTRVDASLPSPVGAAPSAKDKLSDRLARAAAGANSGRSTPTQARGISPQPPEATPSTRPSHSKREEIVTSPGGASASDVTQRPRPQRQDSASSALSVSNARARLSSIEPVAARGGKAYERMLLAGTGLKSIGDQDDGEDEEDEDEEEVLAENEDDGANDNDAYGGAVMEHPSPSKRAKPLRANKSTAKKGHRSNAESTGGAGIVDDESEDDATLVNVEELLQGIDFRTAHNDPGRLGLGVLGLSSVSSGGAYSAASGALVARAEGKGTADVIEASLLSELEALDSANIHSILNGDDRLAFVLDHVDAALAQLDSIDSLVASFKLSLNSRAEDIGFIESQNRGLQVMNANWRALQKEIEQLSQTINVPRYEVDTLLTSDYDAEGSIEYKEAAAASLYKAILQARTSQQEAHHTGMAATTERLEEYSAISASFGNKVFQHLSSLFSQLSQALLGDPLRRERLQPPQPSLTSHDPIEAALGAFCGLMLYVKEVEPKTFERISAAYLTSAAERYKEECSRLVGAWTSLVRKAGEEEDALSSFHQESSGGSSSTNTMGRSATVRRLAGAGSGNKKGRSAGGDGEVSGSNAFSQLLLSMTPLIAHESLFLSDFLHLNSNGLTFADYMNLESYFRRRAAALYGEDGNERRGGIREMRGAMELVFGFLSGDVERFLDEISKRDRFQIVGVLAALDATMAEMEESSNEYTLRTLSRLHSKANTALDRFFADQIKAIGVSSGKSQQSSSIYAPSFRGKKSGRGGFVQAVRILPHFVDRLEGQLVNAHHLGIRSVVDTFYAKMEQTIVDALLSLKVDTASYGGASTQDEDKGVMNHQVLLIENMHHLVQEVGKLSNRAPALRNLIARAEKMYEDSLSHYVHFVLRRPLGKMMDFGDGIDALRGSTPASEVSLHSAYSKSSFKRLVKEYTAKDVRKQVDALWRRVLKHFDEDENESFSLAAAAKTGTASAAAVMLDSDDLVVGAAAEEEERRRVVAKVWRRCEADFLRELERTVRIQNECYKGSGVTLEVQVQDVVRLFQR